MPAQNGSILACVDIGLRLGGRQILDGVSLDIRPGQVLGIAGPNGAGKTSLFEVLSGRQRRHAGQVRLAGHDVGRLPSHVRARRGLGRTYQRPIVPYSLTVGETLEAARRAVRPRPHQLRVDWARDLVHLHATDSMLAGSLETLERRKLMLACLMLRGPRVLLMDEPASGLTGSEIDEIDLFIRTVSLEHGVAVALVEHRLELLAAVAERVVILDVGKVIADGAAETVFDEPAVRAAYFESEAVPAVPAVASS